MAKYESYKLTHSLGFEKIPEEWNLKKVKYLFNIGRGRVISQEELMDNGLYPVFSSQTQNNGCLGYINTFDFDCEQLTWTTDGANAGTVFIRSGKHNCTNVCGTLQPTTKKSNLKFSHYALQYAAQFHKRPDTNGAKIMNNEMAEISFALPSEQEQFKIVEYLNHETGRINTLIAKQEKLIELLKEKRQAVISHAVTKGLNPNVAMKDSGVEWLGQVPEHWAVSALGYYTFLNTGATPDRSNAKYWEGDIPWIKTGEVRYDTIFETEETISELAVKQTSVQLSPVGTLLMAMYGQGITRGRVAILGVPATYNQACVAISPNKQVWNEYLKLFFMAGYHAIRDGGNETSQMNLNADIVKKFKILVPPYQEQEEIVHEINQRIPKIDELLLKAESAIQLMQERRTALISSAVTGKIDVRNWKHPNKNNEANTELGA